MNVSFTIFTTFHEYLAESVENHVSILCYIFQARREPMSAKSPPHKRGYLFAAP